ncbi:hypothetical protein FRC04_010919 [Tulasnella sp. 424]|nr:hypothetical protein FRC04_010919 [Tulasnella sp. 424]
MTHQSIPGGKEQLMERPTSIQDLPTELLLYIFRLSFDITSLKRDRCRLILVCQYWRDVVQESAYLWTEISADDDRHYAERSLAKSKDLPIDLYYIWSGGPHPQMYLSSYVDLVTSLLFRSRSISLISQGYMLEWFESVLEKLQSKAALRLESLILKGDPSQRRRHGAGANPPQLPETSAFPKLRRLEIEGTPCELPPQGLQLHRVLSLNLVDVINVSAEQLLEVLRNSPYLESLELGRSPITCPVQPALTQVHLPHLTTLHLIFLPLPVSNFFLSTLHTPNCSKLFISSQFPQFPNDVVRGSLFTSSTNHFTPVLQTLLARGRHKDIDVTTTEAEKMEFFLQFHDQDRDYTDVNTDSIIRLEFRLNSVQQIEETMRWLGGCFQRDAPKISIRLFMYGIEEVQLMNLLDSYTTITHLGFGVPSDSEDTMPNPILVHMAQSTQLGWPLPNLEVFVYRAAENAESQGEVMLDMLRRRYVSSSEEPDNERMRPRPIKRVRVGIDGGRNANLLGEVRKILPKIETSGVSGGFSFW